MLQNYSVVLDNELAGCAHPDSYGDCSAALECLRDKGVATLVSLDEEGCPLYLIAEHGLRHLHLPIPDFHPPTLGQAEQFVAFTRAEKEAGRMVAVHCRGGYGRTGTMLACYLVSKGETATTAVERIRKQRPGSVETREQEKFVQTFENYLRSTDPSLDRRSEPRQP